MSIGLAFVQGLVGGFQKNIEREQIAREKDSDKITNFENMVLQGAMDSVKSGKAFPSIFGDRLKAAKDEVANQPDIGPFGTGTGKRVNLNMAELSNQLGSINAAKPLLLGQGTYGIPVDQNYYDKSVFGKGVQFTEYYFAAMQKHFLDPKNVIKAKEHFDKKPLERESFIKEWDKMTGDYVSLRAKSMNAEGVPLTIFPKPEDRFSLDSILNSGGILGDNVSAFNASINALKNKGNGGKKNLFPKTKPKNTIYLEGLNGEQNSLFSYELQDEDDIPGMDVAMTGDMKFAALTRLAQKNNFTGENANSNFIKAFRTQLEKSVVNISDVSVDVNGVRVFTPNKIRDSYRMLMHAINLEHLGAGKKLSNIDKQKEIFKYLEESVGDNNADKINALASVIVVPESDLLVQKVQQRGTRVVGGLVKTADKLKAIIGITPTEFNEKYAAGKRTRDGLKNLRDLKMGERTASGFAQAIKSFVVNVAGEGGSLSQLGGMLASRGGENTPISNAESLKKVILKLQGEGVTSFVRDVGKISAQEALMLTLAADMARAVDPAGRLSNQDFEVQLRKLGAAQLFQGKTVEMAKLQVVIDDFEKQMKRIDQINLVMGSASDNFLDKRELQILYANKKYNAMMDAGDPFKSKPNEDKKEEFDPLELMPDGRKRYVPDGKGGFKDRLKVA